MKKGHDTKRQGQRESDSAGAEGVEKGYDTKGQGQRESQTVLGLKEYKRGMTP